jgi:hypothetical protein
MPNTVRRENPIAFRIAISRIRSRTVMLAVFAAMNTMHTATSAVTSMIRNTSPSSAPKKFLK